VSKSFTSAKLTGIACIGVFMTWPVSIHQMSTPELPDFLGATYQKVEKYAK
jgi:hypothetical protein